MNVIEQFLARAAGLERVRPGDRIRVGVDLALAHDGSAPAVVSEFARTGTERVFAGDRVIFCFDHALPAPTVAAREGHRRAAEFAEKQGIRLFDRGEGVVHQVVFDEISPGRGSIVVGADGHVCTAGGYGALGFSVKPDQLSSVLATGEFELTVPEVAVFEISGHIKPPLSAKDVILHVLGRFGPEGMKGRAAVFTGEAMAGASVDERMTITNMVSEMGALTGYVSEESDPGPVESLLRLDVKDIPVSVARPPSPCSVGPIEEVEGTEISEVIIGACSCGRLSDMEAVAGILKGRRVHRGVTLVVVPASRRVAGEMDRLGLSAAIRESGGIVVNPGCGPCFGAHQGLLMNDDAAVSTTTRNNPGRIGDREAQIYLASPLVAAESAVAGRITRPG